ncbi:hypothetical protein AY586_01170 [Marichromatium gracile]|uniref:diguanylate cyclase n=2 Tax=Marichromatium gracile TaxID=1048 RepID=A0ABR5VK23_MARGR|nr:hypothetical protein AY586_01170 [Marichromatium gracile]
MQLKIGARIMCAQTLTLGLGGALFGPLIMGAEQLGALLVFALMTLVTAFTLNPLLLPWICLRDLRQIADALEGLKRGNYAAPLPTAEQPHDPDDENELNRLKREILWMRRAIEQRERDIGSQAERIRALNAELRVEAVTDKLTGLYNARFFWERIADCFEQHHRTAEPFTFAILDIDHFKRINDTYGHLGGDRVLAQLAGILRADTRDSDVLARIGGEEFALILHRISPEDARARLARLRERLHRDPIRLDGDTRLRVTVSIGYTVVGECQPQTQFAPPRNPQEIVKRADDALYWIKANGRNGCIAWSELDPHYRRHRLALLHCDTRRPPCVSPPTGQDPRAPSEQPDEQRSTTSNPCPSKATTNASASTSTTSSAVSSG